jgi:hypothetical protein
MATEIGCKAPADELGRFDRLNLSPSFMKRGRVAYEIALVISRMDAELIRLTDRRFSKTFSKDAVGGRVIFGHLMCLFTGKTRVGGWSAMIFGRGLLIGINT